MDEGHFRPRGCKTPEPIHLKFGKFDYVHRPTGHVAAENAEWDGHKGEVVPSRPFSFYAALLPGGGRIMRRTLPVRPSRYCYRASRRAT